jgi:hypothetical protein
VSTVGLVPEMQRFTASSRAQLAVSLHATTDDVGTCTWASSLHAGHTGALSTDPRLLAMCLHRAMLMCVTACQQYWLQNGGGAQVRDWLCPVNRRWPLAELLGALARDYPRRPNGAASRHFVLIEYVMLSGVNDTLDDAHRSGPACHASSMTRTHASSKVVVGPDNLAPCCLADCGSAASSE